MKRTVIILTLVAVMLFGACRSNKNVVTQAGSSALTALTEGDATDLADTFASLEQTPDYNSAVLGLDSGLYDAVAIDIGVAQYYLNGGKAE